jgi:hypothetical protein
MNHQKQQRIETPFALLRFLVSYFLGWLAASLMARIPLEGRLPYIPVNPLVPVILFLLGVMFWKSHVLRSSRSTLFMGTTIFLVYVALIYSLQVDTSTAVTVSPQAMQYLTVLPYLMAVLPFILKQPLINFRKERAELDSVLFAASIMWLSPFTADILFLLKWWSLGILEHKLSYMVLGGSGTNDVVFFYGFWVFIAVLGFHFLGRIKKRT